MYRPAHFDVGDLDELHEMMRAYPFATVVSHGADGLAASHVPVLLETPPGGPARLLGHVARANPQWRTFDGVAEVLVIFQGPHAYVSPSWMEAETRLPTWNYVTVHAYGRPRVIEQAHRVRGVVERLVAEREGSRSSPWTMGQAPPDFVEKMLAAIVPFEFEIERLEGKRKLSQNKSEADRRGVIAGLEGEGGQSERDIARLMRQKESRV